jgi:hypothetical protein
MPATAKKQKQQVTTLRVPSRLFEEARTLVEEGRTEAGSFNEFVVESLHDKIEALKQEWIDAEFAGMANDPKYRQESEKIAEEFATSDWNAFSSVEGVQNS